MSTCTCLCVRVYVYVPMCTWLCVHVYVYVYVYMYVSVCMCICMCMCMCNVFSFADDQLVKSFLPIFQVTALGDDIQRCFDKISNWMNKFFFMFRCKANENIDCLTSFAERSNEHSGDIHK